MERNGTPIAEYPLHNRVATGISYSGAYEQWSAAIACGLDIERYYRGEYESEFLSYAVAWWRDKQLIAAHQNDAAAPKPKGKR